MKWFLLQLTRIMGKDRKMCPITSGLKARKVLTGQLFLIIYSSTTIAYLNRGRAVPLLSPQLYIL